MQLHLHKATPIGIKATSQGYAIVLARATSIVPGRQAPVLSLGEEFRGRGARGRARRAAGTETFIPEGEPASKTLERVA